jgi:Arf-GAP/coiled-coil/ANK repeat/PH domain-containing protein
MLIPDSIVFWQDDKTIAHHTVNLLTSTIKNDAEQTDLRFCFRIVSPQKTYTLQAENATDRVDWMDKIQGVIATLLNSQLSGDVSTWLRLGT